jgi:4-amino-4-deoxy-L-arabinose transferase-like glycosyltransferase
MICPMPEALPNASTGSGASRPGRGALPGAVRATLLAILLGAILIRTVRLKNLPAGLFCDEAALGYNAWAILHYGIDENGTRFPLFLWSFTGYKNPVYLYAAMLPIGVLGLDEFSLRLTSALFGVATILALFWLGRRLAGNAAGLAAAFLLAICPWHIHFSRIAFELISFPLLFVIGLHYLLRYTEGEKRLPAAFFFFGSCLYAYAVAKLFVPLFLLGFGLLYLPDVWRRRREWLLAVPVLLLTVTPVVVFDIVHRDRGNAYFLNTSILAPGRPAAQVLRQFGRNYAAFFSPRFLFRQGDEIVRHAVRGHGELYIFFAPLLVIGILVLLFRRDRPSKLVLVWLALYPVGASLMNEIPSATRGFIGSAAFCLVAAVGVAAVLDAAGRIRGRTGAVLEGAAVAALVGFAGVAAVRYLRMYAEDYNSYAAPTIGGFQYGYRQAIAAMEPQRARYGLLMLTATDVNQPQIFPLFYNRVDPRVYSRTGNPGYLVLDPAEYSRWSLARPVLYAVRPEDLAYFSDDTVQKEIRAPGGQLEMLVVEVRARKNYIASWQGLGPFESPGGNPMAKDPVDPAAIERKRYPTRDGPASWRPYTPTFVRADLNMLYRRKSGEPPDDVCGYQLTIARAPEALSGFLELSGSETPARAWWNGGEITSSPALLKADPEDLAVRVAKGDNTLVVKSCKGSGGPWFLLARVVSADRKDIAGLTYRAEIPEGPPPPAVPETAERQIIEGFDRILAYRHEGAYPDYRGGSTSWWAYRDDDNPEVRWLTGPVPRRLTTTAVFTASLSDESAPAELWVNGEYALTFQTGASFRDKTWQRGGYRLTFRSKQENAGNSGIVFLTVPPSVANPGTALEIRVVPMGDAGKPWFMLKGFRDTVAFEKVTASSVPPSPPRPR